MLKFETFSSKLNIAVKLLDQSTLTERNNEINKDGETQ